MTRKNLVMQTQISWLADSKIIVISLVQLTKISFYASPTLRLVYVLGAIEFPCDELNIMTRGLGFDVIL
jgi:hypothetical protein